jgi:hypothetical protein
MALSPEGPRTKNDCAEKVLQKFTRNQLMNVEQLAELGGNSGTRRQPVPVPQCPPQIPHDLGSNPGCRGGLSGD